MIFVDEGIIELVRWVWRLKIKTAGYSSEDNDGRVCIGVPDIPTAVRFFQLASGYPPEWRSDGLLHALIGYACSIGAWFTL